MNKARERFINGLIGSMSLEEKVGQLLTFTWRGNILTPSGYEQITKLFAGGLCLEPFGFETCKDLYWQDTQIDKYYKKPKDYYDIAKTYFNGNIYGISVTPKELSEALNKLQKIALSRPSRIPLHISIDFEGDFKNDFTSGGIRQFPSQMGLAAINDRRLTYKVGLTIAKQLSLIGITQIYSPVCDVNINPKNPEIGIRSFSDDPDLCAKHAIALVQGFQDGGLVATAKHFPGRGDSDCDAHEILDVIHVNERRMKEVEFIPFKAVIDAGIKSIMTAHTIYPAYDKEFPSTLSSHILSGILRNEFKFDGVIVSDALGMAAILKKWTLPEACVMAINAGVDNILLKADDESRSQCFFHIKQAVEQGEITRDRLDEAVKRLLVMKYNQGLFKKAGNMKSKKIYSVIKSKKVVDFSREVAIKALIIMKDELKLLPLKKETKILIIEQCLPYYMVGKDSYCHSHMFSEAMAGHSMNLILDDTEFHASEEDMEEALRLSRQAELIVMTNYYARIEENGNNQHLLKKLKEAGHKVVIITNYPYLEGTTNEADVVICNFSATPDSIRVSADLLFGKITPYASTKLPIQLAAI